ncbi:MAG: tetratricopeptide repeat protein [Gammaproteobacteria bacterium]
MVMVESPDTIFSRAATLHQAGHLDQAEPLYRAVLEQQPKHGDALHLLGVLHYQQRDPAAAVPLIEAALRIIPGNAQAHAGLGLALLRLNRLEEALAAFDRALVLKPDFDQALSRRGAALQGLGRHAEALVSLDRALVYSAHDPETLNDHAAALISLGRPAEALADCDRALALQPGISQVLNNRGVALCNLGRKQEAVAAFRAALVAAPDVAGFHANLGATLQELDELEAAEGCLRRALALQKSSAIFQSLAGILYQRRQFAEATTIYQQWLEHEPDNPVARHMAAAGSAAAPERAGDQYVATVFDGFAETFDKTLIGLGYRVPELLTGHIQKEIGNDARALRILDAGCGTGLAAPLLKPMASNLVGVDLSPGMLNKVAAAAALRRTCGWRVVCIHGQSSERL